MRSKQKHALQNIHLYTTLYTIPDTDHHQTAARYIATATQTKIESNLFPNTLWDPCLYWIKSEKQTNNPVHDSRWGLSQAVIAVTQANQLLKDRFWVGVHSLRTVSAYDSGPKYLGEKKPCRPWGTWCFSHSLTTGPLLKLEASRICNTSITMMPWESIQHTESNVQYKCRPVRHCQACSCISCGTSVNQYTSTAHGKRIAVMNVHQWYAHTGINCVQCMASCNKLFHEDEKQLCLMNAWAHCPKCTWHYCWCTWWCDILWYPMLQVKQQTTILFSQGDANRIVQCLFPFQVLLHMLSCLCTYWHDNWEQPLTERKLLCLAAS